MSKARLMQGNEACAEGAIAAGVRFLPVIRLRRRQKLLKRWPNFYRGSVVNLSRWRMKLPAWEQF